MSSTVIKKIQDCGCGLTYSMDQYGICCPICNRSVPLGEALKFVLDFHSFGIKFE